MAMDPFTLANPYISELTGISLSEYLSIVAPLMIFVGSIIIYSLFIFKFYRFIARRDILKLNLSQYSEGFEGFLKSAASTLLYILETIVLTPLFVFFWFGIMTFLLLIISKAHSPETLLLTSVAVVAAVRVASYYTEDLSKDLAKIIPFALLGFFLVDLSYFSLETSLEIAKQIPSLWKILVYYLLFVVLLEFIMRILLGISILIFPKREQFQKEEES